MKCQKCGANSYEGVCDCCAAEKQRVIDELYADVCQLRRSEWTRGEIDAILDRYRDFVSNRGLMGVNP